MAQHNNLGKWGERLATEMLIRQGYAIMDTNTRIGHYEIDIVAMKGDRVVFVEVKTRTSDIDDPLEAIDNKKIRYLCRAADAYIRSSELPHEVQFDVITIIGSPETPWIQPVIEHYPDAFRPPLNGA